MIKGNLAREAKAKAKAWEDKSREELASRIDEVTEFAGSIKDLLRLDREARSWFHQVGRVPKDCTDPLVILGVGVIIYWNLKMDLFLKSGPATTSRITRSSTAKSVSPAQQLDLIVKTREKYEQALSGDENTKKRFALLLEGWKEKRPKQNSESVGRAAGATPRKGAPLRELDKEDRVVKDQHLKFAAFFSQLSPEVLGEIETSLEEGNRIPEFMALKFDEVVPGIKAVFDALRKCKVKYYEAITSSSFSDVFPAISNSLGQAGGNDDDEDDDDDADIVFKFFLGEVDDVKDHSEEDWDNEIRFMHKASEGKGSKLFTKPLDWSLNPVSPFVAMEYIRGGTLKEMIGDASISVEQRLRQLPVLAKTMAAGIYVLHGKMIIHRDVKSENIMLRKKGDVATLVIVDFGLGVKVMIVNGTFTSEACGTDPMMAPEVWMCDGLRKTNKVDIFCSGMTLLEYVFGTDAFVLMSQYNKRNADTGALFTPDQLRGKLTRHFKKFWNEPKSAEMIELLVGMTETDPNERLSAEEWLHHPALKDVSDPLEVADDVPVSDASSPPQDNVEQLKVNLEAAKHRVADAEEKTAGLKTENAELKEKLDVANQRATKAEDEAANLQAKYDELEKKLSDLKAFVEATQSQSIESLEEDFSNVSLKPVADTVDSSDTSNSSQSILLDFALKASHGDILNRTKVKSTLLDFFLADVVNRGALYVFSCVVKDSFDEVKKLAIAEGIWPSVSTYLAKLPQVTGTVSQNLTPTKSDGKKYKKLKLKDDSAETQRRKQWRRDLGEVMCELKSKLTNKATDADDFPSALRVVKSVVNTVFEDDRFRESRGFGDISDSFRKTFSILLALLHTHAGQPYVSYED